MAYSTHTHMALACDLHDRVHPLNFLRLHSQSSEDMLLKRKPMLHQLHRRQLRWMDVRPGDSLLKSVAPKASGGFVHTLQPRVMPEIIARCGMRWWNAKANEQVASAVRSVVITHNLGGDGGSYDALRANERTQERG
jgi:hypothetical protein